MNEHHPDMDLIMALASGELPPEEAARAESELDPEARAELAAQRAVLAALGELGRPEMTAGESRRLRAAVRTELDLDHERSYATVPRVGRRPRFARALPALAAAASIVAVIAIAVNLADRPLDEQEAFEAAATMAPATTASAELVTTAAAAATTAAAAEAETTIAMAEEAMAEESIARETAAEEADMLADAEAAMEEAEAAMDEVVLAQREQPDSHAATTTTVATTRAPTTLGVTDTTASFAAEDELPDDFAFVFSTDRPDAALVFTDAVIVERGEAPFPLVELADRAAAVGLVCWAHLTDAADPGDYVSFMGYGLIDGEPGEAYRIEPDRSRSQEAAGLILLFAYPECQPVDFRAG